jgi:outer membrane protein
MKQIKIALIAAVVFLGTSQFSNAQAKLAHVDVAELISKMPAMLEAQKQLEKVGQGYQAEYSKMNDEFVAKAKKYDAEAATATAAVNAERQTEVQDMQKRIQDFGQNAQKELQQKQEEITKPIYEKVKASIKKIAKLKGFQYVLDASNLLVADGVNITADVKKDLGF